MTDKQLDSLSAQIAGKDSNNPPLHLWNPELSGDIDIRIDRDGRWFHDGGEIKRQPLVNLFASILRRENDGDYYLLTPVEKWRIRVECMPLMAVEAEFEHEGSSADQMIHIRTNTDKLLTIGEEHPLEVLTMENGERVPTVSVKHGLSALLTRSVYYQLAERCIKGDGDSYGLYSEGHFFPLDV